MVPTSSFVLKTIYIDESVDQALTAEAQSSGLSKGSVFRRLLSAGIRAVRQGRRSRAPMPVSAAPLVLKTVRLSPKVDDLLRVQAFDERLAQNEVMRQYLHVGLQVAHGG